MQTLLWYNKTNFYVEEAMDMSEREALALIGRRRRQILVHSCIYYVFGDSLVSDETWTAWALELEQMQKEYPDAAGKAPYAAAFLNFDHSTGYDLPLRDAAVMSRALQLLRMKDRRQKEALA